MLVLSGRIRTDVLLTYLSFMNSQPSTVLETPINLTVTPFESSTVLPSTTFEIVTSVSQSIIATIKMATAKKPICLIFNFII